MLTDRPVCSSALTSDFKVCMLQGKKVMEADKAMLEVLSKVTPYKVRAFAILTCLTDVS